MNELKEKIIKYLEAGVSVSAFRLGVSEDDFKAAVNELKQEGRVTYKVCYDKLPDGRPAPYYGDYTDIRLRK